MILNEKEFLKYVDMANELADICTMETSIEFGKTPEQTEEGKEKDDFYNRIIELFHIKFESNYRNNIIKKGHTEEEFQEILSIFF